MNVENEFLHGGRRHRIARVKARSSPTALRRWPGVDVVTQKGSLARKSEQHASDGRPASVRQLKGLRDRDAGQGGVAFSAPGSGTIDDVSGPAARIGAIPRHRPGSRRRSAPVRPLSRAGVPAIESQASPAGAIDSRCVLAELPSRLASPSPSRRTMAALTTSRLSMPISPCSAASARPDRSSTA